MQCNERQVQSCNICAVDWFSYIKAYERYSMIYNRIFFFIFMFGNVIRMFTLQSYFRFFISLQFFFFFWVILWRDGWSHRCQLDPIFSRSSQDIGSFKHIQRKFNEVFNPFLRFCDKPVTLRSEFETKQRGPDKYFCRPLVIGYGYG